MESDKYTIQIDPSKGLPPAHSSRIIQFMTRREAEAGARAIGWSTLDAHRVEVMGFYVWTIMETHNLAVTRDGFAFWSAERSA